LIFGGIVVVAGTAATILGAVVAERLKARMPGSYFIVSAVAMLIGFPIFIAALYVPFPYAWIFMFLAVFCLLANTGPANTILANVTHPSVRTVAFAANIFTIHAFGDVISPLVIGVVADATNMNTAFLMVGFFFLAGGAFWLAGARHLKGDTERALSCDLAAVVPAPVQKATQPRKDDRGNSITYTSM
jgi:MFS family permease